MAQITPTGAQSGGGDGENSHGSNITGASNPMHKPAEYDQIMHWLSPLEPRSRHQDVRTERLDGVGYWLLETSEFCQWSGGEGGADKAVLFCFGDPGVGKTYLSSLVIDRLCDQPRGDIAVAGLYCDFTAQHEHTITNMIGAILKQLIGKGDVPKYLREAFQEAKAKSGGRGPRLPDLMQMLRTAITSLSRVFICIDALDECLPKYLPELLGSLRDIVQDLPRTRVFFTGRPHVKENIHRYFTKAVAIPIIPNRHDILRYLEMRLDTDSEREAMNSGFRADILSILPEKTSNIFLLAWLYIEAILGEVTISSRRRKLEEVTRGNGLSDAYTATLTRLKAQEGSRSRLGLQALMWVQYSERPLRAKELCHALGVEMGSTDLDPENVPALQTILRCSLRLLTVETSSSTVRLVHDTLREHLLSDPTLFHNPHSAIAEACLTYLNFQHVRDLSPTLCSAPAGMPFLEYASCYWIEHTRKGIAGGAKILPLQLLSIFDEHISASLLLLHHNKDRGSGPSFDRIERRSGFTGLHGAAFLGILEIVAAVLEMKEWDVNAIDCMGSTALTWAAREGHEEVVKALLERNDVYPDPADSSGRTPLSWAAETGCEGAVKALLEREDVNPDLADSSGRTPLLWAASRRHERVVKLFLEHRYFVPDQVPLVSLRIVIDLADTEG